ncbi:MULTISPECIES: hypothetical protein [Nocardia]|uniref:hypothetical protein n=1 Tax=Nocardia TaxID=1817 RepID=UPI000D6995F4|nr:MULTISPECIES: hypothetical protein [Nocardia]
MSETQNDIAAEMFEPHIDTLRRLREEGKGMLLVAVFHPDGNRASDIVADLKPECLDPAYFKTMYLDVIGIAVGERVARWASEDAEGGQE